VIEYNLEKNFSLGEDAWMAGREKSTHNDDNANRVLLSIQWSGVLGKDLTKTIRPLYSIVTKVYLNWGMMNSESGWLCSFLEHLHSWKDHDNDRKTDSCTIESQEIKKRSS
jgi:hypothetical protein